MGKYQKKSWPLLFITLAPVYILSYLSGLFARNSLDGWYKTLSKPALNPPDIAFSIVWSILYLLIGLSLWQLFVMKRDKRMPNKPLVYFFIQLGLNFLWTPAFFGMKNPILGLIIILPMWLFILLTIKESYRYSKIASLLLVPYYLWVSFALYLNAGYVYLN